MAVTMPPVIKKTTKLSIRKTMSKYILWQSCSSPSDQDNDEILIGIMCFIFMDACTFFGNPH